MPFSLAEVTFDPDMGQAVTVLRSTGQFVAGGWQSSQDISIPTWGVLEVDSDKAMKMIPEGDRIAGALALFTNMQLVTTHEDAAPGPYATQGPGLSDRIFWNGDYYSINAVGPWGDFGYYYAVLLRVTGS
jgi:hypothetical protein